MFNKGLDSSEKQEGLLKRLKNIADKTDNQLKAIKGQNNELDLVKNQKTKQSDPIDKIKFSDEKLNKLDDVMKKTKKFEDEDLEYTVAKGDINPYKNLEIFVKKIVNGEMSVKKAKEQPDELWNEIFKMKEGASKKKKGRKFSTKNKRIILNLIKGGNDLHNIRDKIINVFEEKSRVKF